MNRQGRGVGALGEWATPAASGLHGGRRRPLDPTPSARGPNPAGTTADSAGRRRERGAAPATSSDSAGPTERAQGAPPRQPGDASPAGASAPRPGCRAGRLRRRPFGKGPASTGPAHPAGERASAWRTGAWLRGDAGPEAGRPRGPVRGGQTPGAGADRSATGLSLCSTGAGQAGTGEGRQGREGAGSRGPCQSEPLGLPGCATGPLSDPRSDRAPAGRRLSMDPRRGGAGAGEAGSTGSCPADPSPEGAGPPEGLGRPGGLTGHPRALVPSQGAAQGPNGLARPSDRAVGGAGSGFVPRRGDERNRAGPPPRRLGHPLGVGSGRLTTPPAREGRGPGAAPASRWAPRRAPGARGRAGSGRGVGPLGGCQGTGGADRSRRWPGARRAGGGRPAPSVRASPPRHRPGSVPRDPCPRPLDRAGGCAGWRALGRGRSARVCPAPRGQPRRSRLRPERPVPLGPAWPVTRARGRPLVT